jgi:two-component system sensor histidine kinase YesM
VLIVLGLAAGYLFSKIFRSLTNRIQLIIDHMRHTNQGQPDPIPDVPGTDELGQLIENYNTMVGDIQTFAEYRYQSGMALKSYELKVLQEQINPHFLYNTLEMVNWLARNGQNDKVSRAVTTLAQFYRASLRRGSATVTLAQELEHVRAYIDLQNMRFEDILEYRTEIPAEAQKLQVPRIILQPVVENAILHGVLESGKESGVIDIKAELNGELLLLRVKDDGKGIGPEALEKLNGLSKGGQSEGGFGIYNVVQRIQLMYGTEYGLSYTSGPEGTEVTFKLPVIH